MSLIIKQYDPSHQRQRVARKNETPIQELPPGPIHNLSVPEMSIDHQDGSAFEEGDSVSNGSDNVEDPQTNFPSGEKRLSLCTTDVSSGCTPASTHSPAGQTEDSIWRSKDTSVDIENHVPDSSHQTTERSLCQEPSKTMLQENSAPQNFEKPISLSNEGCFWRASTSKEEDNLRLLSTDNISTLATAVVARLQDAERTSLTKMARTIATRTLSSKRSRLKRYAPGALEEHDPEIPRPLKRPRPFRSTSYLPLHPGPTKPALVPPRHRSKRASKNHSGQVLESSRLRSPSASAFRAMSSSVHTCSSISLSDIEELLRNQTREIGLLVAGVRSPKRGVGSNQRTKEYASVDGSDDEDVNDVSEKSDEGSDSDGASSQLRSAQRRRWTRKEEFLLENLKNNQESNGTPSDSQISVRLNRSEDAVKQHWAIMGKKKMNK